MNNDLCYILVYKNNDTQKILIVTYDTQHINRLYPATIEEGLKYKLIQRIIFEGTYAKKIKFQGDDYEKKQEN